MSRPLCAMFLLFAVVLHLVAGHVEDMCFAPPNTTGLNKGVYNFYSWAERLGCNYASTSVRCVGSVLAAGGGFGDSSTCRGVVHFNSVYFTAAALGFSQEIAYFLAAFSQAIDFVQYKAIDSCGQPMPARFWTPPLRGLTRTNSRFGGTVRHLGVPFVGFLSQAPVTPNASGWLARIAHFLFGKRAPPMTQKRKTYTGNSSEHGCEAHRFRDTWEKYVPDCAALRVTTDDPFYEGSLYHAHRWAFNTSNILCNGGFTVQDTETGSIFTGSKCPLRGSGHQVDISVVQQGPIPVAGGNLELGEQIMHYECDPNCTAAPTNVVKDSRVFASQFGAYLRLQSQQHGYAVLQNGDPVPEAVARIGIFLHWLADRASHWYCTDAAGSGMTAVSVDDYYDLYLYLDKTSCNFVTHAFTHYWEQGMNGAGKMSSLSPGSYSALLYTYRTLLRFRQENLLNHPDWFNSTVQVLTEEEVVGTIEEPGYLQHLVAIREAKERLKAQIDMLNALHLPPLPGLEKLCL